MHELPIHCRPPAALLSSDASSCHTASPSARQPCQLIHIPDACLCCSGRAATWHCAVEPAHGLHLECLGHGHSSYPGEHKHYGAPLIFHACELVSVVQLCVHPMHGLHLERLRHGHSYAGEHSQHCAPLSGCLLLHTCCRDVFTARENCMACIWNEEMLQALPLPRGHKHPCASLLFHACKMLSVMQLCG